MAEEEKRKQGEQKHERAEARKCKQEEKTITLKRPRRSVVLQLQDESEATCPTCLIPENPSDGAVWVECEVCQHWYHATCADLDGYSKEELQHHTFVCDACTGEMCNLRED